MGLVRQIAYRQRESPPNPEIEPDGWKRLPPVSIHGTLGDQKALIVRYTLFLAMPVSSENFNRRIHLMFKCNSYPMLAAA